MKKKKMIVVNWKMKEVNSINSPFTFGASFVVLVVLTIYSILLRYSENDVIFFRRI